MRSKPAALDVSQQHLTKLLGSIPGLGVTEQRVKKLHKSKIWQNLKCYKKNTEPKALSHKHTAGWHLHAFMDTDC